MLVLWDVELRDVKSDQPVFFEIMELLRCNTTLDLIEYVANATTEITNPARRLRPAIHSNQLSEGLSFDLEFSGIRFSTFLMISRTESSGSSASIEWCWRTRLCIPDSKQSVIENLPGQSNHR